LNDCYNNKPVIFHPLNLWGKVPIENLITALLLKFTVFYGIKRFMIGTWCD